MGFRNEENLKIEGGKEDWLIGKKDEIFDFEKRERLRLKSIFLEENSFVKNSITRKILKYEKEYDVIKLTKFEFDLLYVRVTRREKLFVPCKFHGK